MPTLSLVLACAATGFLLWVPAGLALARRLLSAPVLAMSTAPILGWAAQNTLALALSEVFGFSVLTTAGASVALILLGLLWPTRRRPADDDAPPADPSGAVLAILLMAGAAALIALVPASAIFPKTYGNEVALAAPIYDHAKVALIDEMLNSGVPPANPVYGAQGGPGHVAYYYLWHFGAAQTALLAGTTGWAADIASSWFTSFATALLVAGLAFRLAGGGAIAPAFALAALAAGNLRPVMDVLLGPDLTNGVIAPPVGFGGFLFQSSWSPHHVAASATALLATLLMVRLARAPSGLGTLVLGLVLAAGFQASLWVGGVTFALAGLAIAGTLLVSMKARRGGFLLVLVLAAAIALAFAAPLLQEQIHAAAARGGGSPVRLAPFPALAPEIASDGLRPYLDLPAFALFLIIELPAVIPAGLLGLAGLLRAPAQPGERRLAQALAALVVVSIAVSALLVSTAGENNDLGWRAILPGAFALAASAGAGVARWLDAGRTARFWASTALLVLAVPATAWLAIANGRGDLSTDGAAFARDPAMWEGVRALVGPKERLASNPDRLAELTPWPINASWALLARRRSCYGGDEMALAFAPLTKEDREQATALFERVFSGSGTAQDMEALRTQFGCQWALVTAQDGAFGADPFAADPHFRKVRDEEGRWRLYHAAAPGVEPTSTPGAR